MSASQRAGIKNGIWLCQICAKLVDSDQQRYSLDVLMRWKITAEQDAQRQIGKPKSVRGSPLGSAERCIKNDLKLRDTMRADLLKGAKEYAQENRDPRRPGRRPFEKFRRSEVVIHRLGDDCYPKDDYGPGISSWFKLELFDFYETGIVVVLGIERGIVADSQVWASIEHDAEFDASQFREINVWRLGRIPFRNIRHYDPDGDQNYPQPHIYCAFDHDGMPYEDFTYAVVGGEDEYDWPLDINKRLHESPNST